MTLPFNYIIQLDHEFGFDDGPFAKIKAGATPSPSTRHEAFQRSTSTALTTFFFLGMSSKFNTTNRTVTMGERRSRWTCSTTN